ncbi:MAG: class I SAM-dependent methyltransferase, partial [Holosporales bacterium]|nr:class I SAM-dependent methyltransferase [Holosporales bacterium]
MSVFKRISALIAVLFVVVGFGSIFSHEEEAGVEYVDVDKLDSNSDELDEAKLKILMKQPEVKFLSGLIRRYKPKKILEVGVADGGSSVVILNSIKDDKESKLYSIDISGEEWVGRVVQASFPELAKTGKWRLFKGNIAAKFLDEIGDGIDFVFLDTLHVNPGEFLDFLMMLPYLKEGAVIVIHDVMLQHLVGGLDPKHAEYLRAMCKKFIQ